MKNQLNITQYVFLRNKLNDNEALLAVANDQKYLINTQVKTTDNDTAHSLVSAGFAGIEVQDEQAFVISVNRQGLAAYLTFDATRYIESATAQIKALAEELEELGNLVYMDLDSDTAEHWADAESLVNKVKRRLYRKLHKAMSEKM